MLSPDNVIRLPFDININLTGRGCSAYACGFVSFRKTSVKNSMKSHSSKSSYKFFKRFIIYSTKTTVQIRMSEIWVTASLLTSVWVYESRSCFSSWFYCFAIGMRKTNHGVRYLILPQCWALIQRRKDFEHHIIILPVWPECYGLVAFSCWNTLFQNTDTAIWTGQINLNILIGVRGWKRLEEDIW